MSTFAVVLVILLVLLLVLLAPSGIVLFVVHRVTYGEAVRAAWRVWIAQIIAAVSFILLADRVGLLNPAGYSLAICVGIGITGALFLHSRLT